MANSNSTLRGLPTVALSTTVLQVNGVKLATAASGMRYQGRDDVALIELAEAAETQCLYTTNKFCAAPVTVARRHHAISDPRYLVINAGNANAGTGIVGELAAVEVCRAVASAANCAVEAVLPFSTGVIGKQLNAAALVECVPRLMRDLRADSWPNAAAAILTTDTVVKLRSAVAECGQFKFSVTGMTKGSGMIKPDMATMLAYVATDAAVSPAALNRMLKSAADASFNRITVDGDTSTNDAFALIATGSAGNPMISDTQNAYYSAVYAAIELVSIELAKDVVRDGEGATKFVTVTVSGGQNGDDCRRVAYAVAESPLVKTAFFASDPNWGRILAAIGRAGTSAMDINQVCIDIGPQAIVRNGQPVADYNESAVQQVMEQTNIEIGIVIGDGAATIEVWTCDLSYDYVRINAEYRS